MLHCSNYTWVNTLHRGDNRTGLVSLLKGKQKKIEIKGLSEGVKEASAGKSTNASDTSRTSAVVGNKKKAQNGKSYRRCTSKLVGPCIKQTLSLALLHPQQIQIIAKMFCLR